MAKNIDVFEPEIKEDYLRSVVPMRGYKSFEYRFVPRQTGNIIIPAIEFSYFNPGTNEYQIVHTDSLQFSIVPASVNDNINKESLVIKTVNSNPVNKKLVIGIAGLLLIIFGILLSRFIRPSLQNSERKLTTDYKEMSEKNRYVTNTEFSQRTYSPAIEPLYTARLALVQQDCKLFYKELNIALRCFIANKLSLSSLQLDNKTIEKEMRTKGN